MYVLGTEAIAHDWGSGEKNNSLPQAKSQTRPRVASLTVTIPFPCFSVPSQQEGTAAKPDTFAFGAGNEL